MAGARFVIGIDLGGTNVRAALVARGGERDGEVVRQERRSSPAHEAASATIAQMVAACSALMAQEGLATTDVLGVGVGLPGIMDVASGVCHWSPNFPHWKDVPIGAELGAALGLPAFILNDAKCAALGELHHGAGRGARHMVMITLGTGIGGAFVVDGRLLIGPNGSIGEVGHHTVDPGGRRCGCGNYGCWEAMCARDAIIERAERKLQAGLPSQLRELAPRGSLTPELVSRAAAAGDALALAVMEETGFYVGLGVANLINLMNPERFVIGGGIARAGELLLGPVRRTVEQRAVPLQRRTAEIVPARLGDSAGVVGAAVLVRDRLEEITPAI